MHIDVYFFAVRQEFRVPLTPRTPWFQIMTSLPFIACLVIKFAGAWVFNVQTLNQPMWLRDVLMFDVTNNGIFSALPYIGQFVGSLLSGVILDAASKTVCSATRVRKITFCVCLIFPGAAIFSLAFLTHEERVLAICLTIFTTTIYSAVPVSLRLVVIEIAPRYTGILMGIVTTLGSVPGMVAPLITSVLTYKGSVDEWDEVFFMCSGMYVGAALLFLFLGSSKEQSWAGNSQNTKVTTDAKSDLKEGEVKNSKSDKFCTEDEGGKGGVRTESLNSQNSDLTSDTESALALKVIDDPCSTIHGLENPGFTSTEDDVSSASEQTPRDTLSNTAVATTNL
ncbi:sialin-like [Liolophura sinensis]|uniref:sialin-like n=1 Tax=Liolophura sinensis TaxID=3198878 RepID=UPI003158FD4B